MAKFDNEGLVTVRANRLVVGEPYTMGFTKNPDTHRIVFFLGFFENGNKEAKRVNAPKFLHDMPKDMVLRVLRSTPDGEPEIINVVKAPDNSGSVFTEDADGELRRVTFGAHPRIVEKTKKEEIQLPDPVVTRMGDLKIANLEPRRRGRPRIRAKA